MREDVTRRDATRCARGDRPHTVCGGGGGGGGYDVCQVLSFVEVK